MPRSNKKKASKSSKRFAAAVSWHIENRGINRTQFASQIGMSASQLSQQLNGYNEFTGASLQRFADALGFDDCFEVVENSEVSTYSC